MFQLINTHSVLCGIDRDRIRALFRFVNTLVQFCGEHACSVSCRFCVLDTGFALV